MASQTTVRFFMKLLPLILIISVLSGGADSASGDERRLFQLQITREGSTAVTTMNVLAEDENEARNQVVLNGWVILKIEERTPAEFPVNEKFRLPGAPARKAQPEKKQQTAVQTDEDDFSIAFLKGDNLTYIGKVRFLPGSFTTELTDEMNNKIASLKDQKQYLILGHTNTQRAGKKPDSAALELFRKRADFLKTTLVRHGISAENISSGLHDSAVPPAETGKSPDQKANSL